LVIRLRPIRSASRKRASRSSKTWGRKGSKASRRRAARKYICVSWPALFRQAEMYRNPIAIGLAYVLINATRIAHPLLVQSPAAGSVVLCLDLRTGQSSDVVAAAYRLPKRCHS